MFSIKVRQQTERAGIAPTLSVAVAGGFALGELWEVGNQPQCQVSETQSYYQGKPLIEGFLGFSEFVLRQAILNLSFRPKIGAIKKTVCIIIP